MMMMMFLLVVELSQLRVELLLVGTCHCRKRPRGLGLGLGLVLSGPLALEEGTGAQRSLGDSAEAGLCCRTGAAIMKFCSHQEKQPNVAASPLNKCQHR